MPQALPLPWPVRGVAFGWLTLMSGSSRRGGDLQFLDNNGVSHGRFNLTTLAAWRWLESQAFDRIINKSRPEDACQESMRTLSRA